MDTPQSNALLKRLIAAVERVGHNPEILRQDLNRHSNTIRAAQERSKHQGDIKPIWLDPILAKYEQSEGNHHKKDDRQYGVQNSLRWATWFTFGAVVICAGMTLLIDRANENGAHAAACPISPNGLAIADLKIKKNEVGGALESARRFSLATRCVEAERAA